MILPRILFGLASFLALTLAGNSLPFSFAQQARIPDFTAGDPIPAGQAHDWNLGPTGARGWIYSNRLETTEARQIRITSIAAKSPADGVLQPDDVLLGVEDRPFQLDPRTELGQAISRAEASDGKLELLLWRNGQRKAATIAIPAMGSYSATAPFHCPKSEKIFRMGCDRLAFNMQQNPTAGNRIVRSLNSLALLSSGREEFLPIIREQVKYAAEFSDVEGRSLCCWFYGPTNLLIAEYTLATGDRTFLPDLERISMEIVQGQSAVGSWGHRFSRPDGRLNGYGMMNAPGLPLTLSLILARKAGVSNPRLDQAIEKSVRLMRFYTGKGCIPYGDHAPWMETHDDNGKNGIAAVMFNVLQDQEAAEYFSRMSVASHGAEREMGHTGNFFNMLWALPGVTLSGPQASGQWMQEFGWYYDLARQWDGSFQHQGPAQPGNDSYHRWDSTGAYLLAYAQPLRHLYITGKQTGVVPQVSQKVASDLIDAGRGYSHRLKTDTYGEKSIAQLYEALSSWSPVVRQRAADALARREGDFTPRLIAMLNADLYSRLGSCQALASLKGRAASAVPQLRDTLQADELWLRIKAAEALSAIGGPARVALPDLLSMLQQVDTVNDPRGMQQRYLCFALFNRRNGMVQGSLDNVDMEELYQAVRAGLLNEDGRARSEIANLYKGLSYEAIEPLLPAIYRSVVEPAPSGIMFADGIRLAGLQVLAKHKIQEGLPLCVSVMERDRWGAGNRLPKCLDALKLYGAAAKGTIPHLQETLAELEAKNRKSKNDTQQINKLKETIQYIQAAEATDELRSLGDAAG